MLRPMLETFC